MAAKLKETIGLSSLRKLGVFKVNVEGEIYTAPFSKKPCVWYAWIYKDKDHVLLNGFTNGTRTYNEILIKSPIGDVWVNPSELQPYLNPSFRGNVVLDGRPVMAEEFCLEQGRRYYAVVEKFSYHLPPLLLYPRRRSTSLLALSDAPFIKGRPRYSLIPPYQGRSG